MKRIGLCIQFEGVDNYGTVLQAMATKNVIESLGYHTTLVRYKRKYDLAYIIKQFPRLFDSTQWKIMLRRKKRKHDLKKHFEFKQHRDAAKAAFIEFRKAYFPPSDIATFDGFRALEIASNEFDAVLVGSDQLWLPAGVGSNFYNLQFAASGVKRISYATSFGVSTIPDRQKDEYRRFLSRMDSISVREESGVRIIRDLIGKEVFLACDPVMLMLRSKWEEIIATINLPKEIDNRFMLCYFLGGSEDARNAARKIANARGLLLVAISYMEDYFETDEGFGDVAPIGIRPEQFVKLIHDAECIMTDSFHGTAFSIIFEKPFLTTYRFANSSRLSKNSRIDNVLTRFNLSDRLYSSGDPIAQMDKIISYDIVTSIREKWQKESLAFLKKALEEGKSDVAKS